MLLFEIKKQSKARQWKYVNTSLKPEDHASRGLYSVQFQITGPEFLPKPEAEYTDSLCQALINNLEFEDAAFLPCFMALKT